MDPNTIANSFVRLSALFAFVVARVAALSIPTAYESTASTSLATIYSVMRYQPKLDAYLSANFAYCGLDRERILAKAIERGLLPEGAAPSDAEVWQLIFAPGFSTADKVSEQPDSARMMAPTSRALPRRSHQGGIRLTPNRAQAQGMALTKPTSSPMLLPIKSPIWLGR